jgi:hypothetical protein
MARRRINSVFVLETFQSSLQNERSVAMFVDSWVVVLVNPKGLCHRADRVLNRALSHSFALAMLKSPISKGGTEK